MVTVLTVDTFDAFLKEHPAVMVDFWAPWCGPCKMLAPVVEELAEETPALAAAKVNVDHEGELAMRYGIMSIPCLLFFRNGELVEKSIGYVPKTVLQEKLNSIL